ncbi:hypothetical protein AQ490_02385 [Wenjunlia vitaminophila]|uniref:Phosphatidic acid phosphatase type 2/haloperoxidase domain-containing protein n=1 Tax=Wenjunlia vitaminophila TaxID=76728 RepID=A0A0T6LYM0_WENVI|nr:phosphatase PAP2 family protein [Wenjunlia vitaminophila]KRV51072.1 hypothetical protein AQ490_02385 [Wenjunlia vitaminophila]
MAELAWDGSNPDVSLLYDINGVAERAPHQADRAVELIGEYGCLGLLLLLALGCWLTARRRPDAPEAVAAVLWAPIAAGVAVLINVPIRGLVERPRPFVDHSGLEVLVDGKNDYSFVSDHATLGMSIAVALFLVHRRLGALAVLVALFQGLARVYMGVHYPSDVLGGFALGTATALLLAPLALALLTPVTSAVARSRLRSLITVQERSAEGAHRAPLGKDADLAA